jgi:hypothetical protein
MKYAANLLTLVGQVAENIVVKRLFESPEQEGRQRFMIARISFSKPWRECQSEEMLEIKRPEERTIPYQAFCRPHPR